MNLYHRSYPQEERYVLRRLCIDSLNYDQQGNILKIHPPGVALLLVIFSFLSADLFAQQTVTGKVAVGDTALAGATMQVKGTNMATQTNVR